MRSDRYSQLLSKLLSDERSGQYLITRSGLTSAETDELRALRGDAHESFTAEIHEATARLREILARYDPLFVVAHVQASNLLTDWGTYFEPTHMGSEASVELVAGLLASEAMPGMGLPSAQEMSEVYESVTSLSDLQALYGLTLDRGEDHELATLRYSTSQHWAAVRGSAFASHGVDLARAIYSPFNAWSLANYSFTIDDVLRVASRAEKVMTERINELGNDAMAAAHRAIRAAPLGSEESRDTAAAQAFSVEFHRGVHDALTFASEDLAGEGVEIAVVKAVLRELSVSVGSVDSNVYRGTWDASPLVERPFLAHRDR